MTISRVASGAAAYGTTSASPEYPAGIMAGDVLILKTGSKDLVGNSRVSGYAWHNLVESFDLTGTSAENTGPTRVKVMYKIADGTETGTLTVNNFNGNSFWAQIDAFRATSGKVYVDVAKAPSVAASTAMAFTASPLTPSPGIGPGWIKPGDLVLAVVTDTNDATLFTGLSITSPGLTFDAATRIAIYTTVNGNDIGGTSFFATAVSGTQSAATVGLAGTRSVSSYGAAVVVRLSEVEPTPANAGVPVIVGKTYGFSNGTTNVESRKPPAAKNGDLVIWAHTRGSTTAGFDDYLAKGWARIQNGIINSRYMSTFARIHQDADGETPYSLVMGTSATSMWAMVVIRNHGVVNPATDITLGTAYSRPSASNLTPLPGLTTPADKHLALALFGEGTNAVGNWVQTVGDFKFAAEHPELGQASSTIDYTTILFKEMPIAGDTGGVTLDYTASAANGIGRIVSIPPAAVVIPDTILEWRDGVPTDFGAIIDGTITYDDKGDYTEAIIPSGASSAALRWNGLSSITTCTIRMYVEAPASWPASSLTIARAYETSANNRAGMSLAGTGAPGQWRWLRSSNTTAGATPNETVAFSGKYRVEIQLDAANGTIRGAIFALGSDTPIYDTGLLTGQSIGSFYDRLWFGKVDALASMPEFRISRIKAVRTIGAWVGRDSSDVAAIVTGQVKRYTVRSRQTELVVGARKLGGTSIVAVLYNNSGTTEIARQTITFDGTTSWGNARFTGLTENTSYLVKFEVDGVEQTDTDANPKTLRAAGVPASFVFVGGSCQFTGSNHMIWDKIATLNPEFIDHGGDLHYADATTEAAWRAGVDSSYSATKMNAMLRKIPITHSMDNHDRIMTNPTGAGTALNLGETDPATAVGYKHLYGSTGWATPETLGQKWSVGRVDFIHLDMWSVRDDGDGDPEPRTFLGATQKQWFKDSLEAFTGVAIIWFSQWTNRNNSNGRWQSFPTETTEIEAWINARPDIKKKMIMIGGDSHSPQAGDGDYGGVSGYRFAGIPSLNISGYNRSGDAGDGSTGWNILNTSLRIGGELESNFGGYSRCTITDDGNDLRFKWEAVRVIADGTENVMASFERSFGQSYSKIMVGSTVADEVRFGSDLIWKKDAKVTGVGANGG